MSSSACSFQIFSLAKSAWERDPFSCSCMPGPVDKVMRVVGTAFLAIANCFLLLVEFACSAIGLRSEISKFENAIESLDEKSLNIESFHSLFQNLLKSPLVDKNWEAWTRLMDRLVDKLVASEMEKLTANRELPYKKKSWTLILQNSNKYLAKQIKLSPHSISKFINFLESKYLGKHSPSYCYVVFEVYKEEFSSQKEIQSEIDAACKKFLTNQAIELLQSGQTMIDINLSKWFCAIRESNEELPELLKDVLWERIQSLHTSSNGLKKVLMIDDEWESFPHNFMLPLAKLITDAEITLVHNGTIDPDRLSKPEFALNPS